MCFTETHVIESKTSNGRTTSISTFVHSSALDKRIYNALTQPGATQVSSRIKLIQMSKLTPLIRQWHLNANSNTLTYPVYTCFYYSIVDFSHCKLDARLHVLRQMANVSLPWMLVSFPQIILKTNPLEKKRKEVTRSRQTRTTHFHVQTADGKSGIFACRAFKSLYYLCEVKVKRLSSNANKSHDHRRPHART